MMPFHRQPEPPFWRAKEGAWLARVSAWRTSQDADPLPDPLAWSHENRRLRQHFHELVRAADEPQLCAYCDNGDDPPADTVDHFAPRDRFPELALAWNNILPSCVHCNERYKQRQWSCRLVRPDEHPVSAWFDFDELTGELLPAARLDSITTARVRLTIVVLRLNVRHRCQGRLRVLDEVRNAWKSHESAIVEQRVNRGPYRFVARRAVAGLLSKDAASSDPESGGPLEPTRAS